MFTLHWELNDFGERFRRAGHQTIKAQYSSFEAARAQAEHDRRIGRHPLRIEDATGKVVWYASDPDGQEAR